MVTRTSMVAKLLIALGLFRDGEALMRQNLRRSRPGASEHEVEQESRKSVTSLRSSSWLVLKTVHRTRLTSEP